MYPHPLMRGPDLMPFGATVVHSLAPHSNVLALPETGGKPDYFPHLAGRVVPVAVSGAELVRKHGQLVGVRRLLGLGRAPRPTSRLGLGHRAPGILPRVSDLPARGQGPCPTRVLGGYPSPQHDATRAGNFQAMSVMCPLSQHRGEASVVAVEK